MNLHQEFEFITFEILKLKERVKFLENHYLFKDIKDRESEPKNIIDVIEKEIKTINEHIKKCKDKSNQDFDEIQIPIFKGKIVTLKMLKQKFGNHKLYEPRGEEMKDKFILDPCCSGKAMWGNKNHYFLFHRTVFFTFEKTAYKRN